MATKPTVADLQREIAVLKADLARLTGRPASRAEPEEQADYVEHGSDEHAALLGLRKATEEDGEFVIDGWALEDITTYPPSVTPEFLKRVLRQKVNELTTKMPVTQSVDPRKPHFAPVMWKPGQPFRQITE